MKVAILPTGAANLASMEAAFRRLGCETELAESAKAVDEASFLVLPGVGAFQAAMRRLSDLGLVEPLQRRIAERRPTLAVCLGLQLLFEASEESPGVAGLGCFPGHIRRFGADLRVPQLGWNRVEASPGCQLLQSGEAYFANSYRLQGPPQGAEAAWTTHGQPFVSAFRIGGLLACQFHPELSGAFGESLLKAWLDAPEAGIEAQAPPTSEVRLLPRLIPCLDVKDGRIVKGIRFQGLRDAGDPVSRSLLYAEQGADELVLLDVSATPEGRGHGLDVVKKVREGLNIPLTVGGGVRSVEDAGRLLDAGADKVGVNTAAVARPAILKELADQFGRQCVVLALDAARREDGEGWEVVVRSGKDRTGKDALDWAAEAEALGAGEILLTSWDRDGTGSGYDLELISGIRKRVSVPIIASGGAATPAHLSEALHAGADAVLAATIFHDGQMSCAEVKNAVGGMR